MIFVEPDEVYAYRKRQDLLRRTAQSLKQAQPAPDDFWTPSIIETVNESREPVTITTLVNTVARLTDHKSRADREGRKRTLFRLVGRLVRNRRLERVGRKFVTIPHPVSWYLKDPRAVPRPSVLRPPDI